MIRGGKLDFRNRRLAVAETYIQNYLSIVPHYDNVLMVTMFTIQLF